jgi:hypothetical protein
MISRLSRLLIVLTAAVVAYAGPVAACLCVNEPAKEMPCCPDDVQQQDHSNCPQSDSELTAACDTVPADFVPAGTQDLSLPVALSAAPPPWVVHGPPAASIATSPPHRHSSPIYLVTQRLRI